MPMKFRRSNYPPRRSTQRCRTRRRSRTRVAHSALKPSQPTENPPMSPSNLSLSDMQIAVGDKRGYHWELFLTQGVIMTILGILAVVWPGISTIGVDVYVGWLFLISGIVGLFTMFLAQDAQAFL